MPSFMEFIANIPVSALCIDFSARSINKFDPNLLKTKKAFTCSYNHSPVMIYSFLEDIHKTDQIFQPLLFCRKNYFKQHKSWGYPIFHFIDDEPEIYDIPPVNNKALVAISSPEDVAAIYVLQESNADMHTQNIISYLDRKSGTLSFQVKDGSDVSLVVFRKLFLYFDHGLKYLINIHDDFLLSTHGKKIAQEHHLDGFSETRLDADLFFANNGFISYSPEIMRNYHHISSTRFLADKAIYIFKHRKQKEGFMPTQTLLYNRYLNGNLLAKLNYIHPNISFQSSITNSYMLRNLATAKTVFHLDTDRFQFEPSYKRLVICNLQRIKSYLTIHNLPGPRLQAGTLFDVTDTFEEKKSIIDQLLLNGAAGLNFKITVTEDNNAFFNQFIFLEKERHELYKNWLTYVSHMASMWDKGKIMGGALILFPSWDSNHSSFFNDMNQIMEAGITFHVVDQQEIKAQDITIGTNGEIHSCMGIFDYLLIPATQILSQPAIELIKQIIDHGGRVVALTQLPSRPMNPHDQIEFKRFISEYWFENPGKPSISFKEQDAGGKAYLVREPSKLEDLLKIIHKTCPLQFSDKHIAVSCKQTDDGLLVFMINHHLKRQNDVQFFCKGFFSFEKYNPFTNRFEAMQVKSHPQAGFSLDQSELVNGSILMRALPSQSTPKLHKTRKERLIEIS